MATGAGRTGRKLKPGLQQGAARDGRAVRVASPPGRSLFAQLANFHGRRANLLVPWGYEMSGLVC